MENFKNYSRITKKFQELGLPSAVVPNLLEIQVGSFENFLQREIYPKARLNQGLQQVFNSIFPIEDSKGLYILEFIEYEVMEEKYSIKECIERNFSFQSIIKARMRLTIHDEEFLAETGQKRVEKIIEQDVFLGNIPIMTPNGTFIINGAERVIISQLHRSYGIFFTEEKHPSGKAVYSAKVIPAKGSWLEFTMDVHNVIYVNIDKRRKLPVTALLRSIGLSENEQIRDIFYQKQDIPTKDAVGRYLASDLINPQTGEVIYAAGTVVSADIKETILDNEIKKVVVVQEDYNTDLNIIENTIEKDDTTCADEANKRIYLLMRPGEKPQSDVAAEFIKLLFFNERRYSLGEVGRHNINKKLNVASDTSKYTLTKEDIIAIVRHLITIFKDEAEVDDIDHLTNRRVKAVGELLQEQYNTGLFRVARVAQERMSISNPKEVSIHDLVNSSALVGVVQSFFLTGQLSQFMEQTNPLAAITHKRRFTALGPGGLTRDRAGFEVRDVNNSHYGRICPIETPEGPNIGLISSPAIFARINKFGYLETPYYEVVNGVIQKQIVYLEPAEEERSIIAQTSVKIDDTGKIVEDFVFARYGDDFIQAAVADIQFIDVSPQQTVSASAALIPFLEHDDANRALMGSNMQRQAVPLLNPQVPVVGTGIEKIVAVNSGAVEISPFDGEVVGLTSSSIELKCTQSNIGIEFGDHHTVKLSKFERSNQDTCINQRPVVKIGQKVKKGEILTDGPAITEGRLALGRNLKVAFMPWYGYNYEDAIILSEKVAWKDVFTSLYIEVQQVMVREMKAGEEELVYDIPDVAKHALRNLDKTGIIRIGSVIEAGDIIVGKITPKSSEIDPSPEENLMRALFGDKAGDFSNTSLKAKPGMEGVVVDIKVFSRREESPDVSPDYSYEIEDIRKEYLQRKADILAFLKEKLADALVNQVANEIKERKTGRFFVPSGKKITADDVKMINFKTLDTHLPLVEDEKQNKKIYNEILYRVKIASGENENIYRNKKERIRHGDVLEQGVLKVIKVYIAKKRKIAVGDKMAGRHGNKGVISIISPVEDMPFTEDGEPVDIVLNPLGVPSRMNIGQILETHLGMAAKLLGFRVETPVFDGAKQEDIQDEIEKANLPIDGKFTLYDGKTGEPFKERVTVGIIYILKLNHLVVDKMHARSTGPYSLITQQPLGGKAQNGGQRLGEMEVWALEAYGSAHLLEEMLTIKSDDMEGRTNAYKAIASGENPPTSGVPESFKVLVSELKSLGFDIEFIKENSN